jgi:hypothetical protein
MYKPILSIDFDGTISLYKNGWQGIDIINEDPVPGAMKFIYEASKYFIINIFSTRSKELKGERAMRYWTFFHLQAYMLSVGCSLDEFNVVFHNIQWPTTKPSAFLSIDDRALQFQGDWSIFEPKKLLDFRPWNKPKT